MSRQCEVSPDYRRDSAREYGFDGSGGFADKETRHFWRAHLPTGDGGSRSVLAGMSAALVLLAFRRRCLGIISLAEIRAAEMPASAGIRHLAFSSLRLLLCVCLFHKNRFRERKTKGRVRTRPPQGFDDLCRYIRGQRPEAWWVRQSEGFRPRFCPSACPSRGHS